MVEWAFVTPQAESVLDLFRATGAYLEGHFRLTSGLHSPNYLQCALVLRQPPIAEDLGRRLAAELRSMVDEPVALVVSPALGGGPGTPSGGGTALHGRRTGSPGGIARAGRTDRKSTRLNSSHLGISYAVFCLKK